jgi:hypothetical protein
MPQRFEISFRIPRSGPAGQSALPRPTSRIKIFLQSLAALLVASAIITIGVAVGTAVAVLISVLTAIALAALFIRGAFYRIKSTNRS